MITSEQLFYPIKSVDNIEAMIYPSVQRSGFGDNLAMRNDVFLQKYNFVSAETKFILEEYPNHDPKSNEPTTDQVMASFYTYSYNPQTSKISYNPKVDEIFDLFKKFQDPKNPQTRFDNGPGIPKNLAFNMSDPQFIIPEYLEEFRDKNILQTDETQADEEAKKNTTIGLVDNV
jgi:hypothetical protein